MKLADSYSAGRSSFKGMRKAKPHDKHLPSLLGFGDIMAHIEMAKLIALPIYGFAAPCFRKGQIRYSRLLNAIYALAVMLNNAVFDHKTLWKAVHMVMSVTLFNGIAGLANKELCGVSVM